MTCTSVLREGLRLLLPNGVEDGTDEIFAEPTTISHHSLDEWANGRYQIPSAGLDQHPKRPADRKPKSSGDVAGGLLVQENPASWNAQSKSDGSALPGVEVERLRRR